VHLAACADTRALPRHRYARAYRTRPANSDPATGTAYVPVNRLFSLRQWLQEESPQGTVLMLDPDCAFRYAIADGVEPGRPVAQHWVDFSPELFQTEAMRARLGLDEHAAASVQQATWPLLIHTEDLRRILPTWIEYVTALEPVLGWERDMFAFTAACARAGLVFSLRPVGVYMGWPERVAAQAPVIHYCQKIRDENGDILWFKQEYVPWEPVRRAEHAALDYAREFLHMLDAFAAGKRTEILDGRFALAPGWRLDVVQGQHQLRQDNGAAVIELNETGALVAGLCDGVRLGRDISALLCEAYPEQAEQISRDLVACLDRLCADGALTKAGVETPPANVGAVDVRVHFLAVPSVKLRCDRNDPLIGRLFAALEDNPGSGQLLCLPNDGDEGRMLYVPSSQVAAVETWPPLDPGLLAAGTPSYVTPASQSPPLRIMKNYLPESLARQFLAQTVQNRDGFEASSVTTKVEDYRRSKVLHLEGALREQFEARVYESLLTAARAFGIQIPADRKFDSQLTASGHGDFFKSHRDRGNDGEETSNRLLTYVYYFHREPKPFSGGELRLYDFEEGSWNPAASYRTIAPEHNMLVVFPSWANHEVLPVIVPSGAFEDSRFTVNGWLLESGPVD
jgi:Rps23 Pro-64 3,4-dihydroxylase Tpa1-like proline 4-hydroxylase